MPGRTETPAHANDRRGSRQRIIAAMSYQSDGVGNGQAGAATSAAAGENLTAVLGGHTGTEAVHLGALTLLGLISSDGRSHNYTLLMIKGFFMNIVSGRTGMRLVVPCKSYYSILHQMRGSQALFKKIVTLSR